MLLLCGTRADFAMSQGFQPRQKPSSAEPPASPLKVWAGPSPSWPRESGKPPAPRPPSSDGSSMGRGLERGQCSQAEAPTVQTPREKGANLFQEQRLGLAADKITPILRGCCCLSVNILGWQ